MTRSEFRTAAEEVFAELLPKVKASDRKDFITELASELQSQGLDIEDDEEETDEDDEGFEG